MVSNIFVENLLQTPMEEQRVELVERKGTGHPDSIADALSETVSRQLSRMYLEKFGKILHHNTDETQIVGGQAHAEFGGGSVYEPIYILLVGRAVTRVGDERLPYRTIALGSAREYLKNSFQSLDVDYDVSLDCRIGQGSVDLRGLYDSDNFLANDTSFGVSFAPLSETEMITKEVAGLINGKMRMDNPAFGEDIKVMCSRWEDKINITIACAMVDKYVKDVDEYNNLKDELQQKAHDHALNYTGREVEVFVNTADNEEKGIYYLTVTGLSMENGDDGSVGRGNRANGLITPGRPMSMEASAGKNPVTHVGKIYNLVSNLIANDIIKETGDDVQEAYVRLLSQIGQSISDPQTASAQLIMKDGVPVSKVQSDVEGIMEDWLTNIDRVTKMVIADELNVF